MKRKKLTTYDYLASKGKRQLSNIFCHSKEESTVTVMQRLKKKLY